MIDLYKAMDNIYANREIKCINIKKLFIKTWVDRKWAEENIQESPVMWEKPDLTSSTVICHYVFLISCDC